MNEKLQSIEKEVHSKAVFALGGLSKAMLLNGVQNIVCDVMTAHSRNARLVLRGALVRLAAYAISYVARMDVEESEVKHD